jgi:hypothetical protein
VVSLWGSGFPIAWYDGTSEGALRACIRDTLELPAHSRRTADADKVVIVARGCPS